MEWSKAWSLWMGWGPHLVSSFQSIPAFQAIWNYLTIIKLFQCVTGTILVWIFVLFFLNHGYGAQFDIHFKSQISMSCFSRWKALMIPWMHESLPWRNWKRLRPRSLWKQQSRYLDAAFKLCLLIMPVGSLGPFFPYSKE